MNQDPKTGGRFGRTPFRPDDLKEQYGTTDSGRLEVECPGCGRDYYPSSTCCVQRRAGSPFCPDCGIDFRASEDDIQEKYSFQAEALTDESAEMLREFIEDEMKLNLVGEKTVLVEKTD